MDIRKFKETTPGKMVPIGGGAHAYIPAPLPPKWKFPEKLWPLLLEAKEQMMLLEGFARTLPDPDILLPALQGREAIQTSALEGTYATPRELLLFELEPKISDEISDPANAWKEVFNCQSALRYGTTTKLPISQRLIRKLHEILMDGVLGEENRPGEFRKLQVAIGSSRRFVPPPAAHLAECLDTFEKYLHKPNDYNPLVDCFIVHYQFEAIHPFRDGNGRVGRILLAIMIHQRCNLSRPWMYMSDFFVKYRDEYVQRLFSVSTDNAWSDWIEFCLQGAAEQARLTLDRCAHLSDLKKNYAKRLEGLSANTRLRQIVDDLFRLPMVRISDIPERLGVTYPTAKADVDRLVEAGILEELPGTSVKTFQAPEIVRIVFAGIE